MRKWFFLVAVLISAFLRVGAAEISDTITSDMLVDKSSDDDLIFSLLTAQSRELARRDSALHHKRLLTDTTTLFPFHVGYADSLRIDSFARANPCYDLTLPMLYIPDTSSLAVAARKKKPFAADYNTLVSDARRYITAHAADVYKGVYGQYKREEVQLIPADLSQGIDVERSLVKDFEEDRKAIIRQLHNRHNPWNKQATVMVQITQNYVSKNWYAGGNSSFALLGILQGTINYDDKKRITWENSGEWRAGVNTVSGDTLRKINVNDDLLRLYTKFGYKVYQKLYLSTSAELQSQLLNTWKDNTQTLKTGTLTPLRFNFTVGLDYKPINGLSIVFSPVAYKLVYALDTVHSDPALFSIPKGDRILNEIGSSMRVEWKWNPVREINLESKFYFYTNYSRVELDLEVTCNFIITRYLSARLMLHPRYDNTVILPQDEKAKLQFKEMISLGFAHKFR